MGWRVPVVLAGVLALGYPLASMAQWNADAAQTGANIYCEAIYVGRSTAEADAAIDRPWQSHSGLRESDHPPERA